MAMNPKPQLAYLLLTILALLSSSSMSEEPPAAPSVYEILQEYGLPSGLLPDSVKSYTLSDDGKFEVHLEKPCYVQFDYLVYYETKITGKLAVGSITNLKGIQVQRFFLWFNVDEIKIDLPPSDSIYFTVGIINKKLDVGQFETVHSCRDNTFLASCGDALQNFLEPQTTVDDIQMLITE